MLHFKHTLNSLLITHIVSSMMRLACSDKRMVPHAVDVEQKHMAALSLSRRAHLDLVMRQWQASFPTMQHTPLCVPP